MRARAGGTHALGELVGPPLACGVCVVRRLQVRADAVRLVLGDEEVERLGLSVHCNIGGKMETCFSGWLPNIREPVILVRNCKQYFRR